MFVNPGLSSVLYWTVQPLPKGTALDAEGKIVLADAGYENRQTKAYIDY